eukprot:2891532-Rhodomonas_salina.2
MSGTTGARIQYRRCVLARTSTMRCLIPPLFISTTYRRFPPSVMSLFNHCGSNVNICSMSCGPKLFAKVDGTTARLTAALRSSGSATFRRKLRCCCRRSVAWRLKAMHGRWFARLVCYLTSGLVLCGFAMRCPVVCCATLLCDVRCCPMLVCYLTSGVVLCGSACFCPLLSYPCLLRDVRIVLCVFPICAVRNCLPVLALLWYPISPSNYPYCKVLPSYAVSMRSPVLTKAVRYEDIEVERFDAASQRMVKTKHKILVWPVRLNVNLKGRLGSVTIVSGLCV